MKNYLNQDEKKVKQKQSYVIRMLELIGKTDENKQTPFILIDYSPFDMIRNSYIEYRNSLQNVS